MESLAFTSLGILQLPSPSRLLSSACCPDKDLVVVISRLGGHDRMSLWNYSHGSRVWEIDVNTVADSPVTEIVALAWSPDGQSVAVAHDPPQITLHSIQDGHIQQTVPVDPPSPVRSLRLTGLWWFQEEKPTSVSSIPDIFKRKGVITGTAHAILRTLPLLDNLQEDSQKLAAADLFGFQGSHKRTGHRSLFPDLIERWPTLFPNPLAASIDPPSRDAPPDKGRDTTDEVDDLNENSLLVVANDLGHMDCFLDGSFPLGSISLGADLAVLSLRKLPRCPVLLAHLCKSSTNYTNTHMILPPAVVSIPLFEKRQLRDLAKLSSTARELIWYIMCVVQEMCVVWAGSEVSRGAQELGPKFIQALENKQKEQFGQQIPDPMLDLTTLLVTGRASDALLDFLGSGEQMSERGIQKWESTLTEALIQLRDFSEKRLAPACQRLHIVLEELQGWSYLPQYTLFELTPQDIGHCLELTNRAIVASAWLAATARQELSRFKDFIAWLRFETSAANQSNDAASSPRHDILEVNNYLISGLSASSIDRWFTGSAPNFSPQDLGIPGQTDAVTAILEEACTLANDPTRITWKTNVTQKDLNHLDRNLNALVAELATRCRQVFDRAAGAPSRSAIISSGVGHLSARAISPSESPFCIRERTIFGNESCEYLQYLVVPTPSEQKISLSIAQLRFSNEAPEVPLEVNVALLEPLLPTEGEGSVVDADLLEVNFFDDESVIMFYRLRSTPKTAYIATIGYNNLEYLALQHNVYVNLLTREDLMLVVMEHWKTGHLPSTRVPIKRCRALVGCKAGAVSFALNDRSGRRVACLLDGKGTAMESIDLENDGDDVESDGQT